jgi:hypothetical protein
MQYRIKEKVVNGKSFYYPQYKKFLFWRRFVWWGGEDGTFPHTSSYIDKDSALKRIADDKINRLKESLEPPDKVAYHYID